VYTFLSPLGPLIAVMCPHHRQLLRGHLALPRRPEDIDRNRVPSRTVTYRELRTQRQRLPRSSPSTCRRRRPSRFSGKKDGG